MKRYASFLTLHAAAVLLAAFAVSNVYGQAAQKAAPTQKATAAAQKAAPAAAAQKAAPAAAQKSVAQKTTPAAQKAAPAAAQKSSWQAIAEQRAATMAARRYRGHLPGVPNGCFEGVGWGGWNCATCVGSGALLADAQAMGSDGLVYRVRLWSGGGGRAVIRQRWRPFRRWRRG